jgi:SAM-dependent methyltransferase
MDNTTGQFTAHNILLDDGRKTRPEAGFLLTEDQWCRSVKRLLGALYPAGVQGLRIADLGCLEGGFTVEFARMGMDALGLEVRQSNFRNCLHVKQHVDLPNLQFINDDAWNLWRHGTFDVVFCCGLLYHIDRPVAFIRMLSRLCRKVLILNTHFATETANPNYCLSDITSHESVKGRWFLEYDSSDVELKGNLDMLKWASWSNDRSFWIQREHIFDVLKQTGFNLVMEDFDCLPDRISDSMLNGYYKTHDRGVFVGVRVKE